MRNKLKWSSLYNVGINQIDSQHRMLFSLGDKILAIRKPDEHTEEVISLVKNLLTNMTVHFRTEEALFVKFKFPFKDSHIQHHRQMLEEIIDMVKNKKSMELLINDLYSYLQKWLIDHMLEDDKAFAKWASSKEGKENSTTQFF